VSASRFGDLLGWRSAALFALVAVAFVTWNSESARSAVGGAPVAARGDGVPRRDGAHAAREPGPRVAAPLAPLSIAADAVHLGGAALWVGGLPCLVAVLLRAPRVLPEGGRVLASATLARFSKIACCRCSSSRSRALARLAGELSSPTSCGARPMAVT
jgi:hypothetical protein